jgi:rSAM/selenodomain-associated transferase 1
MQNQILGLFAKQPLPGAVKTRLAAATSPSWAANVAAAFLQDTVDRLAGIEARHVLVFAPDEGRDWFANVVGNRFELIPQGTGDLGQRMARFFSAQIAGGARSIVLLGTDSPTLPLDIVRQAFRELAHADLVIGPATDGGYYLIGCGPRLPPVFEGIAWSSATVLTETIARLSTGSWRLALLPPWYDVDTLQDWQTLCGHLAALERCGIDPGLPRIMDQVRADATAKRANLRGLMHQSVLLSSLPLAFEEAVRQAADLGFNHVDVVALGHRPQSHYEALADAGVLVSCAALGRGLADELTLDAASVEARRLAVEAFKSHIADAARLGATHAYVIPGLDGSTSGLSRFADSCGILADFSAQRRVRLCLEHIPGRALPTAAGTLAWLQELDHDNLHLLLDVGHCLITGEDAATVIRLAGERLGYVHLDDNDAVGDLHWPLLTGKLTEAMLHDAIGALLEIGYDSAVTLELAAKNPEPLDGLRRSKEIVDSLLVVSPRASSNRAARGETTSS